MLLCPDVHMIWTSYRYATSLRYLRQLFIIYEVHCIEIKCFNGHLDIRKYSYIHSVWRYSQMSCQYLHLEDATVIRQLYVLHYWSFQWRFYGHPSTCSRMKSLQMRFFLWQIFFLLFSDELQIRKIFKFLFLILKKF